MATTESVLFSDPAIKPDDDTICSFLGEKKDLWKSLMSYVSDNHPESQGSWNYYNDGKRWLFKMVLKKKTLFWAAVLDGAFRTTFYFGGKAEPVIDASDLPEKIKSDFRTGPRYGKIRPITILVTDMQDIELIQKIIPIKIRMK